MHLPHVLAQPVNFSDVTAIWLMAYSALFSIVNPLGASLIFAQMTIGRPKREIVTLARLVGFYSFIILMVSVWLGGWILSFFRISIDALRVAGGLVVASRAWALLLAPEESEARKERQVFDHDAAGQESDLGDRAFFPLAMPFTVGPGSIAVAIALSSGRTLGASPASYIVGLSLAVCSVSLTVVLLYTYAERIVSSLGRTGARIVSRLAALILLCIGIQILFAGLEGFVIATLKHVRQLG
ncbi:MarC family protein [Asaia platycodi]|uniref:MarC family protein n=1 Tax=Asaia platycodi TaxID=610243 RepID=UPI000553B90E|nr:MarC family protein [Asaia platycodi]